MDVAKQKRIQSVTDLGKKHDLDWVLCMMPENVFYFSGFRTLFYTRFIGVLIPVRDSGNPVLITSSVDRMLVEEKIWSPHWFEETICWGPGKDYEHKTHFDALKAYLKPGTRLGVDGIQYDFYRELKTAIDGLDAIDIQKEILEIRWIKSEEEIGLIKQAFDLTENVMSMIPQLMQHPITEKELAIELDHAAAKAGAEQNFYPTLVSAGKKMLSFHSPPMDRPIKEHDTVRVACGWQLGGYGSDVVRHFSKGAPPKELLLLKDAYFEALDTVFDLLKPGVNSREVMSAVESVYTRHGCVDNWIYSVGHAIALTIHELPKVMAGDETVLQENMVLALEPILVCPPHGAFSHCDGVRITHDSAEWLSGKMRDLTIV